MKKSFTTILLFLSILFQLSAKENLDIALQHVSEDISRRVSAKTILCVLDFTSKSKEMGTYIRDSLMESFYENPNIRIVTRENMDNTNFCLKLQHGQRTTATI